MSDKLVDYLRDLLCNEKRIIGITNAIFQEKYVAISLSEFTEEKVKTLWANLVFKLSSANLVKGIPNMPISKINQKTFAIWIKDFKLICLSSISDLTEYSLTEIQKPILPPFISLAIGGLSGVGKTRLIKQFRSSIIGHRIEQNVFFTTRPQRKNEVDEVDYFFVKPEKINLYRDNPRFINFVEARGFWYWSDSIPMFESRWNKKNAIYISTITQVHEFVERRKIFPDLLWIWLNAEDQEIKRRLQQRGDTCFEIEQSLEHNKKIKNQNRTGLVSLEISMDLPNSDKPLQKLLNFIKKIERRKDDERYSDSMQ